MSDLIDILKHRFSLRKAHIKGDELWALCINPKHNDHYATNFSINLKTVRFNCFACGYRGNVVTKLVDLGTSYDEALLIWKTINDAEEEIDIPDYSIDRRIIEAYMEKGFSSYALKRLGGDENLLRTYNIYRDDLDNPIFLSRSKSGDWKSIWVRTTEGKYLLIEPLKSKSYGDLFGEHLPATDYTILVEGHFDAPKVYRATGQKTVCGFGTRLSPSQLIRLKILEPIIVFMDFDDAGRMARNSYAELLSDVECYFCGGNYNNVDPSDLSDDEIRKIISNKKNWFEFVQWRNKNVIK